MSYKRTSTLGLIPFSALILATYGCGAGDANTGGSGGGTGTGGGSGTGGGIDFGGNGGGTNSIPEGKPWDATPIIEPGAPAGVEAMFSGATAGAGCVIEPADGAMLPRNWVRPRFRVNAAKGEIKAYMVKLHAEGVADITADLTVYGGPGGAHLPLDQWHYLGRRVSAAPVTVTATVRAHNGTSFTETVSKFIVAPVSAGGAMVYWASNQSKDHVDSSRLEGFAVGEEATVTALKPLQVSESDVRDEAYGLRNNETTTEWTDAKGTTNGKVSCIGCHTSTPDGGAVAFNAGDPWNGILASIEKGTEGTRPTWETGLGARLLATPWIGTTTFSKGHWSSGKRYVVATMTPWMSNDPYGQRRSLATAADLIWIDLAAPGDGVWADMTAANAAIVAAEGVSWGKIARTGDTKAAATPVWSDDGTKIAYTAAQRVAGSHVGGIAAGPGPKQPDVVLTETTETDIYTVDFANGAGGPAAAVPGAANPGVSEYYPDFSTDGKFIAYNRAPSTAGYIYYRPDADIHVIPTAGGTAHRLAANDAPACTAQAAGTLINSWAKWSPSVNDAGGLSYYWIIFSSARKYEEQFNLAPDYYTPTALDTRSSQLYLAALVVDASGAITSYPAVYVWNQTTDTSNLTPAWDEFKIPPVDVK